MVSAAAGDHSRSLQSAQAGRCLSGIHDFSGIFSNRLYILVRQRRDAGKALQKIQGDAFRSKNALGRSLDFENGFAAKHGRPVRQFYGNL
jgi:hypothetical protein